MTVTYTALTTIASGSDAQMRAEALAEQLEQLGPQGVGCFEVEDGSEAWEVGGYFNEAPDETALALLSAAYGARQFVVSRLEPRDWVAQVKRELTPVEAGRFVVHGAHDRDRVGGNRISLEIEAAMAFGTGHHGTTEGCLLALERLRRRGLRARRVADIGCGTGVLAIAAAKCSQAALIASDIDAVAVATARTNFAANGVHQKVRLRQATGFRDATIRRSGPYDLILMNILARPLMRLAPEARANLAPGGVVVLSGLLIRQRNMVSAVYRAHGFTPLFALERRGWSTLCLRLGWGEGVPLARVARRL